MYLVKHKNSNSLNNNRGHKMLFFVCFKDDITDTPLWDILQNLGSSVQLYHLTTVTKAPDKMTSGIEFIRLRETTEAYTRTNKSTLPVTFNPQHLSLKTLDQKPSGSLVFEHYLTILLAWHPPINGFNFSTAKLSVQCLVLLDVGWAGPLPFGNELQGAKGRGTVDGWNLN